MYSFCLYLQLRKRLSPAEKAPIIHFYFLKTLTRTDKATENQNFMQIYCLYLFN